MSEHISSHSHAYTVVYGNDVAPVVCFVSHNAFDVSILLKFYELASGIRFFNVQCL